MITMRIILVIAITLKLPVAAFSQAATAEDIRQILHIPVLTGEATATTLPANVGRLCFDKMFVLHSTALDGTKLETDLYINSRQGYFGFYQYTGLSDGRSLDTDRDGFRFTIKTLAGNTYVYVVSRSGDRLKKGVITHNSDFYYTQDAGFRTPGSISRVAETGTYGSLPYIRLATTGYQAANSTVKYFLYGTDYPAALQVNDGTKYLGLGGVGFVSLSNKVYLLMAMVVDNKEQTVVNILRNTENCFNTADFESLEDEMYNKRLAGIHRQRDKILRETGISTGPCAGHDLTIKNFRLAMLDREELWLEKSVLGNTLDNPAAREAVFNLYNYEDQLQLMIYEQDRKICKIEYDISRSGSGNISMQRKLECYRRQYGQMQANLAEMRTLKTRYPDDEGRQIMEKARLMLRVEGCN